MIKECLNEVLSPDFEIGDMRKGRIKYYNETFDEFQLNHILSNNGLVANDIYIFYYEGVGFRCLNDEKKTGRLPICNIIQNRLNKKYKELFQSRY